MPLRTSKGAETEIARFVSSNNINCVIITFKMTIPIQNRQKMPCDRMASFMRDPMKHFSRSQILAAMFGLFCIIIMLRFGAESLLTSRGAVGYNNKYQQRLSTYSPSKTQSDGARGLRAERFDESKLINSASYPICGESLNQLFQELMIEEETSKKVESGFNSMFLKDHFQCGNVRTFGMWWIFGKKHWVRTPADKCVPKILAAKRRLLYYIEDQCAVQEKWNFNYKQYISAHQHNEDNKDREKSKQRYISPKLVQAFSHLTNTPGNSKVEKEDKISSQGKGNEGSEDNKKRRGIIYTGKASHFKDIYQSVLAHRYLGCELPVEVWINERDFEICTYVYA